MTDQGAHEKRAAYPHLSLFGIAFGAGRNSVDFGGGCEFTSKELIDAWKQGRRSALAEDALDADTEWDADIASEPAA